MPAPTTTQPYDSFMVHPRRCKSVPRNRRPPRMLPHRCSTTPTAVDRQVASACAYCSAAEVDCRLSQPGGDGTIPGPAQLTSATFEMRRCGRATWRRKHSPQTFMRCVRADIGRMASALDPAEACVGAHHLSRRLKALGHDARLMPAKYVRPYAKGQKNDFNDAEAIAEAALRPNMRVVPEEDPGVQLDLQALHRVRSRSAPAGRPRSTRSGRSCWSTASRSVLAPRPHFERHLPPDH